MVPQDDPSVAWVRERLLAWYPEHRRELPWRSAGDAYAVWVSEVMLQQTQVQTVIPYFERWMRRFPTIRALAKAPLAEVLHCWAGLGYYARARNLHAAAQMVVERHGGELPADLAALRALPGIGRYTAGAILSIAFGVPAPILDGNAIRVLARLFAVAGDPTRGETQRRLWALAAALAEGERPGDLNQAIMELGATVCTPEAPRCACCPVADACRALAEERVATLPEARRRPPTVRVEHVSAVIRQDGALLLARRPEEEPLWGGMWELPRAVRGEGESLGECARRAAREGVGVLVQPGATVAKVRHTVTHHRITLYAVEAVIEAGSPEPAGSDAWAWVRPEEAGAYPLPAPQARLIAALRRSRLVLPLDFPGEG